MGAGQVVAGYCEALARCSSLQVRPLSFGTMPLRALVRASSQVSTSNLAQPKE